MKRHWADEAIARVAQGERVALVTLLAVQGSAPRDAGAQMLVWADGQHDTIGGGNLEFVLTRDARRLLLEDGAPVERVYPLGPVLGQCCGGSVEARIEVLDTSDQEWLNAQARSAWQALPTIYLFGAGHVGQAMARALAPLPVTLCWYDTRPEYAHEATLLRDQRGAVAGAAPGGHFLILTHNHDFDYEIVRAVLARRDAAYCGLIGSRSKRKRFERQLRADGLGEEIRRLTCPIGGAIGLKGKEPAVIAAGTVAELLLVIEARRAETPEAVHAG